jgi:small subunit ribosomal protein S13
MAEDKNFKYIVRIVNTDIDGNRKIGTALTKIKGIGFMFSNAVLNKLKIDKEKKTGHLSDSEISELNKIVRNPHEFNLPSWLMNRRKDMETGDDKHLLVADLDFTKTADIRALQKIKSYRGLRHMWGVPVRGQKTKSNFRRNKGKVRGVQRRAGAKKGR